MVLEWLPSPSHWRRECKEAGVTVRINTKLRKLNVFWAPNDASGSDSSRGVPFARWAPDVADVRDNILARAGTDKCAPVLDQEQRQSLGTLDTRKSVQSEWPPRSDAGAKTSQPQITLLTSVLKTANVQVACRISPFPLHQLHQTESQGVVANRTRCSSLPLLKPDLEQLNDNSKSKRCGSCNNYRVCCGPKSEQGTIRSRTRVRAPRETAQDLLGTGQRQPPRLRPREAPRSDGATAKESPGA